MTRIIWITGRAATGKSTLIAALQAQVRARGHRPLVLSDEKLLLELVGADTDHDHHWHPDGDERIAFPDGYLFDEGLRIINAHLIDSLNGDELVLVELARGRHVPPIDVSYRRALELIDPSVWPASTVIRLDVDFTDQLDRNKRRTTGTGHGTPEDVMASLYRDDDPESFADGGVPITNLPGDANPATTAIWILDILTPDPATTTCSPLARRSPQDWPPIGSVRRQPPTNTGGPMHATVTTRLRPQRSRSGRTYDFDLSGLAGRLTITELPDGRPGEVFLAVGKQGSTLAGLCEALSLMTSLALQHQVPIVDIVRRLIHMRFEPAGHTGDSEVPTATSLADYLGRRLAADYLDSTDRTRLGLTASA